VRQVARTTLRSRPALCLNGIVGHAISLSLDAGNLPYELQAAILANQFIGAVSESDSPNGAVGAGPSVRMVGPTRSRKLADRSACR